MSGVAAIASRLGANGSGSVRQMLAAMSARGADRTTVLDSSDGATATVGVAAHDWEGALHRGAPMHVEEGGRLIVADASLFHTGDLRRALGGPAIAGAAGAAQLILATYARWGEEGFARLEGDFAFIIWDGSRQRLLAARDFAGHRPLFHSLVGGTLRLSSTVGAVVGGVVFAVALRHSRVAGTLSQY